MACDENDILFEERQSMRQPWVWILVVGGGLLSLGLFAHGLYQQLYLGEPWGCNPLSDRGLIVVTAGMLVVVLGLPLLLLHDQAHRAGRLDAPTHVLRPVSS